MAIPIGTRLGVYEIRELLGVGGMGEVYRALDTKLNREVALKVLPPTFARDPERVARFRREAQVLAQLNHPNIAAIYNFEELGDTRFLVMELVLGETLREQIKRGPLPVEETLTIGEQIAEALEHAHEKNIMHRDLKPANVKVTPEGKVKVLDFGLAKAFGGDGPAVDSHDLPTGSVAGTLQGVILGTPAYMSPEQASGKKADRRTDIWALGCVLYELLTGQWAFQSRDREGAVVPADTVQEIIARVLKAEPDWTALPETTPAGIRTLLRRSLQKDLTRRLRDATDARIEIEEALAAPAPIVSAPAAHVPSRAVWRRAVLIGLACLLAGSGITGIALWSLRPAPSKPVQRFVVPLPPGDQLAALDLPAVALSPDGSHLVYVASRGGVRQLYLRSLDSTEARPMPGTEGANTPFFSPDGQWVGFMVGNNLKKVSISGGAAVTVSNAFAGDGGATWGADGTIVFHSSALQWVPAAGGTPKPLTVLDSKRDRFHSWPDFLPGAKGVLFAVKPASGVGNEARVALQVLKTGERRDLVPGGTSPRYAPSGHLLYVQGGTLMATPFDLGRLEVGGAAVPVVEGVMQSAPDGVAQYSVSGNGSLAYISGGIQAVQRTMVWVDRKGTEQPVAAPPHPYRSPRISPDGRRVAIAIEELGNQTWIYDPSRETLTRLTFEGAGGVYHAWTPDGKQLTTYSMSPRAMLWQPADGSGKAEALTTSENGQYPGSWTPDGQALAFTEITSTTGWDLWVLRLSYPRQAGAGPRQAGAEGRKAQPFLRTSFNETAPKFSPDGRWLAYVSNESGRLEAYVQPYPGPGGKWQISTEGGTEPVWNPNGRELFYRSGDKMMAVEVGQASTPVSAGQAGRPVTTSFSVGKPKALFEGRYLPNSGANPIPNYDVSPDGQRFLMLKAGEQQQAATQINVVLNWFEELKRRVPAAQ